MDDAMLVRQFQGGDEAAFEQLYRQYKTPALRAAYLLTGNLCDSENVLQEAFLKCYRCLGGLRNPDGFKSWFWRILTRTAWDYCRQRNRECPVEDIFDAYQAGLAPVCSSLDSLIGREEAAQIMAAINRLPLKQKTVIILYYYNDFSVAEIAEVTGALPATVKSRLYLARRSLQDMLQTAEFAKNTKQTAKTAKGAENNELSAKANRA